MTDQHTNANVVNILANPSHIVSRYIISLRAGSRALQQYELENSEVMVDEVVSISSLKTSEKRKNVEILVC